jgi:hypothetical protein
MVVRGAQELGRRVEFEDAAATFHVICEACRPLLSQATLGELDWDLLTGKSGL